MMIIIIALIMLIEPCHAKTVFGVCDQARLKPARPATEASQNPETLGSDHSTYAANNKRSDETAQMRGLVCPFVVRM